MTTYIHNDIKDKVEKQMTQLRLLGKRGGTMNEVCVRASKRMVIQKELGEYVEKGLIAFL